MTRFSIHMGFLMTSFRGLHLPALATPLTRTLTAGLALLFVGFALPVTHAEAKELGILQWQTQQGARVLFLPAPAIPMVDVAVDIDAGSRWDPPQQSGLAAMVQSLSARGLRAQGTLPALSELAVNEAFSELAIQRSGAVTQDRTTINFRFLSDAEVRDAAAALASRLLAHPEFDADIFDRERKRVLASIRESLTQPQSIATRALWKSVYGDHPYGAQATEASVGSITQQGLRTFHDRYWVPSRMRITLVGDMTEAQARAWVDQLLSHLPSSVTAAPGTAAPSTAAPATAAVVPGPAAAPPTLVRPAAQRQSIDHPATQSHVWLGTIAIARDDPDYFPLLVGNHILGGGGFVSRLTAEVREKRGLSYSVFSAFSPLAQPGPFMVGLQTQKARAPEAVQVVRDTLATFLAQGPTEKELKAAKQNLIGGFALRVDTNRKLLDNLAQINFYNLPLDYLQTWADRVAAVSVQDIRRAMNRVITPDQLSVVVVAGPQGYQP
jgi:zinc protease